MRLPARGHPEARRCRAGATPCRAVQRPDSSRSCGLLAFLVASPVPVSVAVSVGVRPESCDDRGRQKHRGRAIGIAGEIRTCATRASIHPLRRAASPAASASSPMTRAATSCIGCLAERCLRVGQCRGARSDPDGDQGRQCDEEDRRHQPPSFALEESPHAEARGERKAGGSAPGRVARSGACPRPDPWRRAHQGTVVARDCRWRRPPLPPRGRLDG